MTRFLLLHLQLQLLLMVMVMMAVLVVGHNHRHHNNNVVSFCQSPTCKSSRSPSFLAIGRRGGSSSNEGYEDYDLEDPEPTEEGTVEVEVDDDEDDDDEALDAQEEEESFEADDKEPQEESTMEEEAVVPLESEQEEVDSNLEPTTPLKVDDIEEDPDTAFVVAEEDDDKDMEEEVVVDIGGDDVLAMQRKLIEEEEQQELGEDDVNWAHPDAPEEEEEEEPPLVAVAGDSFFSTDDDSSSAFVDRDDFADAYDDSESVLGTSIRAGDASATGKNDRVSIDDVPGDDAIEPIQVDESALAVEPVDDIGEQPVESPSPKDADGPDDNESEQPVESPSPKDGDGPDDNESEQPVESTKEFEGADVPMSIDDATKNILVHDCKYTRGEVRVMKPEIAFIVAQKRLRRPLEGMPTNWIKEGASLGNDRWIQMAKSFPNHVATMVPVLAKAMVPVALGALAIYGGLDVRTMVQTWTTSSSPTKDVAVVSAIAEPMVHVEQDVVEEPQEMALEHLEEVVTESLKPGAKPKAPVDETALDKCITFVLNKFKAFLRMEI